MALRRALSLGCWAAILATGWLYFNGAIGAPAALMTEGRVMSLINKLITLAAMHAESVICSLQLQS